MENNIIHLNTDELVNYRFSRDDTYRERAESHLETCDECKQQLNALIKLQQHLTNDVQNDFAIVASGHLSDEEIVNYVHSSSESGEVDERMAYVKAHIDSCGQCLKAVLRYRTHLAAQVTAQVSTAVQSAITASKKTSPSELSWWRRLTSLISRKMPVWSALPIAALSSVIAIILLPQKHVLLTEHDTKENMVKFISPVRHNASVEKLGLQPASAQRENIINWYEGYVETTAIGTANMNTAVNAIQAELLAKKAAKHIAYANLSETINGLSINAKTTYRELVTEVDALQTQSQGFIRGGRVVNESVEWINGVPKAVVTVRVPLFGNKGVQGLIERAQSQQKAIGVRLPGSIGNAQHLSNHDGVIIDARDIQYLPALQVSIVSPEKEEIYRASTGLVPQQANVTAVRHYPSVETAMDSLLFGGNPVVIKASKSPGSGVLMLNGDDAFMLQQLKQQVANEQGQDHLAVIF